MDLPQTLVRTKRLELRRADSSDLVFFHKILSDPRAMRYWDRPPHTDIEQSWAFLNGLINGPAETSDEYVLVRDGLVIGKAGVWQRPEVGYILHPDHWGQGLATEALRPVLARAFVKWSDIPHITAELDPRNIASARVLEKLGFRHLRTEEKNFLYGNTEWCDTAYYQLERPAPVSHSSVAPL